jgi:hypothetical protein
MLHAQSGHALATYKDVEIDPQKRNEILRSWGDRGVPSFAKRAVYWNSWQKDSAISKCRKSKEQKDLSLPQRSSERRTMHLEVGRFNRVDNYHMKPLHG